MTRLGLIAAWLLIAQVFCVANAETWKEEVAIPYSQGFGKAATNQDTTMYPGIIADKIVISAIPYMYNQEDRSQSKIHYITVNGEKVYEFDKDFDRVVMDHRAQISAEREALRGGPKVIQLAQPTLIKDMQIFGEGWRKPDNAARILVEITSTDSGNTGGGNGEHSIYKPMDFKAMYVGHEPKTVNVTDNWVSEVTLTTTGQTKIRALYLDQGFGNNYEVPYTQYTNSGGMFNSSISIPLSQPIWTTAIVVYVESYGRQPHEEVTVILSPTATVVSCTATDGTEYGDGQTWGEVVFTVPKPQNCTFGGTKIDYYDIIQPKICRAGTPENYGDSYEQYSRTSGSCQEKTWCDIPRGRLAGTRKYHGDTWVVAPPRAEIGVQAVCPYGGSRTDYYPAEWTNQCLNGAISEVPGSRVPRSSTPNWSDGQCNPAPRANCRIPGKTGRDGLVLDGSYGWQPVREFKNVPASCTYGGNKVDVYRAERKVYCDNGVLHPQPGEDNKRASGIAIRTSGSCNQPANCDSAGKLHGDKWTLPQGKTRPGTRRCGASNRGTQAVTIQKQPKRYCDNGVVYKDGNKDVVIERGTCEMPKVMCPAGKIMRSTGLIRTRQCNKESLPCNNLPRSEAGTQVTGTCKLGRDSDAKTYTYTCGANGQWTGTNTCRPAQFRGDR